ncbi:MAG: helix-turn-helix transcriptional regulator [Clostridia bacterium]|nr:helix-turn-helix transcriptional regulator [Clostridia bacterium]
MESINKRITYFREKAGLTKRQMAEKMGLKYTTYCRIENKGKIYDKYLKKFSKILDVDEHLLLYDDFMEEKSKYLEHLEEKYKQLSMQSSVVIVTDEKEKRLINIFRKCRYDKKVAIMEFIHYIYFSKLTFDENKMI